MTTKAPPLEEQPEEILQDPILTKLEDFLDKAVASTPGYMKDLLYLSASNPALIQKICPVRVVCVHTMQDGPLVGVELHEDNDSFYIGAPSKLMYDAVANTITVRPASPDSVVRVIKFNTKGVTIPPPDYRSTYFVYLLEVGDALLSDFLSDDKREYMDEYVKAHSGNMGAVIYKDKESEYNLGLPDTARKDSFFIDMLGKQPIH